MIFRRKTRRPRVLYTPGPNLKRRTPLKKPGRSWLEKTTSTRRTREGGNFWSKLKRFTLILGGGILVAVMIQVLFLSDQLVVQAIQVTEDEEAIQNHPIEMVLRETIGSNILLLDTSEIEQFLHKKYPSYETLRIQKRLPNTLMVVLKKYQPIANIRVEYADKEEKYVLNSQGQIMEGNTQEGSPTLKIKAEKKVKMGTTILSQDYLAFALEAIQNYEEKFNMKVDHALYLKTARELHLYTERDFYVWLDIMTDLNDQLNKLKQALPRLNIYEEALEYIDLRISGINGEKVIFKRKS